MHVNEVIMNEKRVCKVIAVDLGSLKRHSFSGEIFADCTGDATLGLLAGADHAYGRESKHETGEDMAPDIADNLVMGSTNQWHSRKTNEKSDFPIEEWMLQFNADYNFEIYHSYFNWETGFGNMHTVDQAEEIRDHNLRAIYGNWAYIKTHKPEKFAYYTLGDISYVTGKRESYRLIGDIFLKQQDIDRKIVYPDAIVTTTWGIDLHYPDKKIVVISLKKSLLAMQYMLIVIKTFIPFHIDAYIQEMLKIFLWQGETLVSVTLRSEL